MSKFALYLASASPRRHEILKQLHIPHQVLRVPAPDGEDEPRLPGETPQEYVRRTARDKALNAAVWMSNASPDELRNGIGPSHNIKAALAQHSARTLILTADTTVVLDGKILGKPRDQDDAIRTLKQLSGNVHHVHTAIALWCNHQITQAESISTVHFRHLDESEVTAYCETGEPMGKAGAYGIQGPAAIFVSHLSGSYSGVMGLPAYETAELLRAVGYCWY